MRGTQRRRRRKRGQAGGASVSTVRRILRRGPSLQDKIAAGANMFFFRDHHLLGNWDFYWENKH